jgi:hypothetical protein
VSDTGAPRQEYAMHHDGLGAILKSLPFEARDNRIDFDFTVFVRS